MSSTDFKLDIQNWGNAGWDFITSCALMLPKDATKETRQNYRDFFTNIGNVLPCGVCESHFNKYLKEHPIPEDFNARFLAEWLNNLHNEVNESHKKPTFPFLKMLRQYMPVEMAQEVLNLSDDEVATMKEYDPPKKTKKSRYPSALIIGLVVSIVCLLIVVVILLVKMFCRK